MTESNNKSSVVVLCQMQTSTDNKQPFVHKLIINKISVNENIYFRTKILSNKKYNYNKKLDSSDNTDHFYIKESQIIIIMRHRSHFSKIKHQYLD